MPEQNKLIEQHYMTDICTYTVDDDFLAEQHALFRNSVRIPVSVQRLMVPGCLKVP